MNRIEKIRNKLISYRNADTFEESEGIRQEISSSCVVDSDYLLSEIATFEQAMSYEDECIAAFKSYIRNHIKDEAIIDRSVQAFMSGFEYGSLNGASEAIKRYAIGRMTKSPKELSEDIE